MGSGLSASVTVESSSRTLREDEAETNRTSEEQDKDGTSAERRVMCSLEHEALLLKVGGQFVRHDNHGRFQCFPQPGNNVSSQDRLLHV